MILVLMFVASVQPIFAHVVVKPNTVGVAAFQTFTVGVPNEKATPTTQVRLVIPEGLHHVSPNVKPGWKIEIKKTTAEGSSEERVSEIIWSGGSIPVGQRDDFAFSAQAPAQEGSIQWKAYQTYGDGVTVAWDASKESQPKNADGSPDFSTVGPYSETTVKNDLAAAANPGHPNAQEPAMVQTAESAPKSNRAETFSIIALVLATVSLGLQSMKKHN